MMATKPNRHLWKLILLWICLHFHAGVFSQERDTILSFAEFIGYVKKYHPRVKQANLEIDKAEANLMRARGAFDPKLEVDFDKKEFKGNEYYSLLNSSFKIPTWYGIEVKAAFDNSEGIYVNPQNTMPDGGLTSLGITVPIGQGLFINERMADLRMAKVERQLSTSQQRIAAVNAVHDASVAYFNWVKAYDESKLYEQYLKFAEVRFSGIKKLIELGDKPAIDSIEAGIQLKNRRFSLQEASLKLIKARFDLSNYLWIDNIPLELQDDMLPQRDLDNTISEVLQLDTLTNNPIDINTHPKIIYLEGQLKMLEIENRLKQNLLLPKVDLGYYYLSEPSTINYKSDDYKVGLNFSFPLFLRKERGNLKLNNLKIQDAKLGLELEKLELKNKIESSQREINLLQGQITLMSSLVNDYTTMLSSEDRLFSFGESSIFLLNTRENSLVSVAISEIELKNKYFLAHAQLFKAISNW